MRTTDQEESSNTSVCSTANRYVSLVFLTQQVFKAFWKQLQGSTDVLSSPLQLPELSPKYYIPPKRKVMAGLAGFHHDKNTAWTQQVCLQPGEKLLAWCHSNLNDLNHWEDFSDTNRSRAINVDGFHGKKEIHLHQEFEIPIIIKNLVKLSILLSALIFWQNFEKTLVTAPKSHKVEFFFTVIINQLLSKCYRYRAVYPRRGCSFSFKLHYRSE